MKILIVGDYGFFCNHLAERLEREGNEIYIITSKKASKKNKLSCKHVPFQCELTSSKIEDIFKGILPSLVIFLGTQDEGFWNNDSNRMEKEFLPGLINILENMKKFKVDKIIFPSSAAIYGDVKNLPIKESTPTIPISFYGLSKLTAENYIKGYSERWGLDYTILRYSNVFGLRQGVSGECGVVKIFWDNFLKEQESTIFGDGLQTRDFVYIEDVIAANIAAIYKGSKATLNISTKEPVTINELFETMKLILDPNMSPVYKEERSGDIKYSCLCNKEALQILSWKPKYSLQEGIEHMYNEYSNSMM